jgi:hypothetical protein
MDKDTKQEIEEWIKEWDTNEEHDLDLCISLKDWARGLFVRILEEEGRSKAKKKSCPGDCNCRDCDVEVKSKPKKKAKLGSWDNPRPMPYQ